MNWTDHQPVREKLLRKKLFILEYTNIEKVKIFCVLHYKIALLTSRCSEWGTRKLDIARKY